MTRPSAGQKNAPRATNEASRGVWRRLRVPALSDLPGWGVLALGLGGAILLVVTEFTTLYSVDVVTATCEDLADPNLAETCVTKGGEQHGYAFVLLALLVLAMTYGAAAGRSLPAALALSVVGVVVLGIALLGDRPDTDQTGAIGANFEDARTVTGSGLWIEIVAGALCLGAGLVRIVPWVVSRRS
jgi:hypothetical protein